LSVDLIIRGGKIYSPHGFYEGDLVVDSGKIASLTKKGNIKAEKIVDASGKVVLPGMIDMHVHFRDPGFTDREDFETGTTAAAFGGITTVADMPNTIPSVISVDVVNEKNRIAGKKAVVDYAFIGGAGEVKRDDLLAMADVGIVGYKTFMTARFKELAASDSQMIENFRTIAETGLPCLIHAENQDIVARGIEEAKRLGRVDPLAHCEFRPHIAEMEATMRTVMLAGVTDVDLHICHISAAGTIDVLRWAKEIGRKVTGETSANYLLLNEDTMKTIGPYAKIDPPLRGPNDQKALWKALNEGVLDVLASDHAPYPKEDKEKGWSNIFDAPSGGIGVETGLPLMLDCVNNDVIGLRRLVEVYSTNPAILLNLYPKKGVLLPGSDADIVIVDMKKEHVIKGEQLHSKTKITAFEGKKIRGIPVTTIVRGNVVVDEGIITGNPGYGIFQRPIS
jgi:allantoinase